MPSVNARTRHSPLPGLGLSLGITRHSSQHRTPRKLIECSRQHLDEAGESYWKHLRVAFGIACKLAKASAACAAHALVPGFCTRTASNTIAELQALVQRRAAVAQPLQGDSPAAALTSTKGTARLAALPNE